MEAHYRDPKILHKRFLIFSFRLVIFHTFRTDLGRSLIKKAAIAGSKGL